LRLSSKEDIADFIGTDGITGIISKVRLKIRKIAPASDSLLFSVAGPHELEKMVSLLQSRQTAYFGQFEDAGLLDVKRGAGLHAHSDVEGYILLAVFEGAKSDVYKDITEMRELAASLLCKELPGDEAETEWEERFYPMRVKRAGPTVVAGEFIAPAAALSQVVRDVHRQLPGKPAKGGLHGIVVGEQDVIFMPQVFTDERKGFSFLAALSYSKRFNDIGLKYGGKPYGVGHLNAFSAAAVHGTEGLNQLRNLKKLHDPYNIMNPGKGIEHMTKYGVAAPAFVFSLTMKVLGLFRNLGL
jgi:glycolate oxidase